MEQMLDEIQTGTYAEEWIDENETGRPWFEQRAQAGAGPHHRRGRRAAAGDDAVPRRRDREPGRRGQKRVAAERPVAAEVVSMSGRIAIFDTTLRDGEQSPGLHA